MTDIASYNRKGDLLLRLLKNPFPLNYLFAEINVQRLLIKENVQS